MLRTVQRWLLMACVALLVSEPLLAEPAPNGQKYAILIGVSNYESPILRKLPFAENDVTELSKLFQKHGFPKNNIVLMTASEAASKGMPRTNPRSENIRRELDLYLSLPKKGDTVIVALAGHGVQFKQDRQHYFCPVDANLQDKTNLISIAELYQQLEKCKADVKLLFVDACRNDPLTGKTPRSVSDKVASKTRPEIPEPPGGVGAFFSCSKGQESFENPDLKHGVFFHFVLEGLRGKAANSDKQITLGSLIEYVSRKVPPFVVREHRAKQQPELLGRINPGVGLLGKGTTTSPPNTIAPTVGKNLETRVVDLPSSLKMEFVLVPKGTFWMSGSRRNALKQLSIEHDFYIAKYEVTQEQWQAVMGYAPSAFSQTGRHQNQVQASNQADLKRFPVENVSWEECQEFMTKLNTLMKKSGFAVRLPSEAEWEYACRGAAHTKEACSFDFYLETPTNDLSSQEANFDGDHPGGNARKGESLQRTTKVGSYHANALGIFDMHGNVSEWCQDLVTDPRISRARPGRAIRGGSWRSHAQAAQASSRFQYPSMLRFDFLGFRCVLTPASNG